MQKLKTFQKNDKGKDYVVGDLHGCKQLLEDKLLDLNFDYSCDRLFSVGDLVDRGSDSFGCLGLIDEPWFHAVKGNHEDMMCDSVLGKGSPHSHTQDTWLWYQNGGRWAEEFWDQSAGGEWDKNFYSLVARANALPLSIEIVDCEGQPLVGICHAEPLALWDSHYDPSKAEILNILWQREKVYWPINPPFDPCTGIPLVYCGHTPLRDGIVRQVGNVKWIDTGACFRNGVLTIEELDYDVV